MTGDLKEFLSTLKQKLNIIEVASGYISLERRGGSWWACCPFHHEKTPSFSINESDQYYHCFGCGESGDVIKFVQSMENIEFIDAVKMLSCPVIELHISNVFAREEFRSRSVLSPYVSAVICGAGVFGYRLAVLAAAEKLSHA